MELTVQATWELISGIWYLRIAQYQGKIFQIGKRWSWHAYFEPGFFSLAATAFDHGTTDDLVDAKNEVELAIMRHNEI